MNKRLSILLAILALIISTLACAFGQPTLSNVRTAKDQGGAQVTSVFGPSDTIYVVSDLTNGVKGNVVSSKWYAEDVSGVDPNTELDHADIPVDQDSFSGTIYFYFPPPNGQWPTGTYKVEVYFNNTLTSTVEFTVQ